MHIAVKNTGSLLVTLVTWATARHLEVFNLNPNPPNKDQLIKHFLCAHSTSTTSTTTSFNYSLLHNISKVNMVSKCFKNLLQHP